MSENEKKLAKEILDFCSSPSNSSRDNYLYFTSEENHIIARWQAYKWINEEAFRNVSTDESTQKEYMQIKSNGYPFTKLGDEEINQTPNPNQSVINVRDIIDSVVIVGDRNTVNIEAKEKLLNLSDEEFQFLYFVYIKSETNNFTKIITDRILEFLNLSETKTILIATDLEQMKLIEFANWSVGVKITNHGINIIETKLLENTQHPTFVDAGEIEKAKTRIKMRYELLKYFLDKKASEKTVERIWETNISDETGIDEDSLISKFLPYLRKENWIDTNNRITHKGIDKAKRL